MDLTKNLFAKKHLDSQGVRFVTALKITAKKMFAGNYNVPAILFALMSDYEETLSGYQKNTVSNATLSKESAHLAKEFFLEVYYNEEALLKYLNKEITDRWYRANVKKKRIRTFRETHKEVEEVLKTALLGGLFEDID